MLVMPGAMKLRGQEESESHQIQGGWSTGTEGLGALSELRASGKKKPHKKIAF